MLNDGTFLYSIAHIEPSPSKEDVLCGSIALILLPSHASQVLPEALELSYIADHCVQAMAVLAYVTWEPGWLRASMFKGKTRQANESSSKNAWLVVQLPRVLPRSDKD